MNTTTRTTLRLLVATPLAAAALSVGAGVAQAETPAFDPTPGPVIVLPGDDDPRPEGPGEITNPEGEDEPGPQVPGDKDGPNPGDDDPQVPGDKDGPNPGDDDPQIPGDKDGPNPGDGPADEPEDEPKDEPKDQPKDQPKGDSEVPSGKDVDLVKDAAHIEVPSRIDAGAAAATTQDRDLGLAGALAGGGLLIAAGAVVARQRMTGATR